MSALIQMPAQMQQMLREQAQRRLPPKQANTVGALVHAANAINESDLQEWGVPDCLFSHAYAFFVAEIKRLHTLRRARAA